MKVLQKKITYYLWAFTCVIHINDIYAGGIIQWQKNFGGYARDELHKIHQTSDGGYILGGDSGSPASCDKTAGWGGYDYWILKLDSLGAIQWQKTIPANGEGGFTDVLQTELGYLVAGYANAGKGYYDFWLLQLDYSGNIQWQKSIGGSDADWLMAIHHTRDRGFILGGYSLSDASADKTENKVAPFQKDLWIVKIDSAGNIQWQNNIGGTDDDILNDIAQTTDGGYIVGSTTFSGIGGDKTTGQWNFEDYWVLKLDSSGNIQWQRDLGGNDKDYLHAVSQTLDGGYIVSGNSTSGKTGDKSENARGTEDFWLIKLNASGGIEWQKTLGGNGRDFDAFGLALCADSGFVVGGTSLSDSSGDKTEKQRGAGDYWIIKLSKNGAIQWDKTLGGDSYDYLTDVLETRDGNYMVGGYSYSGFKNPSGDKTDTTCGNIGESDYWIVRLLKPEVISGVKNSTYNETVKVYPNPFSNATTFEFSGHSKAEKLILYDLSGEIVMSAKVWQKQTYTLQRNALPAGMFFYSILDNQGNNISKGKIIIQ